MGNTPIGRAGWIGNPYTAKNIGGGAKVDTVEESIRRFEIDFQERVRTDRIFRKAVLALKGFDLICFCKPRPCHGDIILAWLEENDE